jgi:hypothetical protein
MTAKKKQAQGDLGYAYGLFWRLVAMPQSLRNPIPRKEERWESMNGVILREGKEPRDVHSLNCTRTSSRL